MSALQQILFHTACTLRRPINWRWHFAGIRRALKLVAEKTSGRA